MAKVTIVTPSFNQAEYLRRTIDSVLSQDVDLEYFIMDGGSTDGSVDILREYNSRARIVIGKDKGQADAISKGFACATGDILAWLNSDDMYLPGTLAKVISAFERGHEFIYGHVLIVDAKDRILRRRVALPIGFDELYYGMYTIPQETTFFSRNLYLKSGGVNPSYTYAMDYDLWLRMAKIAPPHLLDEYLACFRFHEGQKSGRNDLYVEEAERARRNLTGVPSITPFRALRTRLMLEFRKLTANVKESGMKKTVADMIDKQRGRLPK